MNAHAILPIYKAARASGIAPNLARAMAQRETARVLRELSGANYEAPGPWHVKAWASESRDGSGFADVPVMIADRRGFVIAAASNDAPALEANATAARIVECVNAFRGIPNPGKHMQRLREYAAMLDKVTRP